MTRSKKTKKRSTVAASRSSRSESDKASTQARQRQQEQSAISPEEGRASRRTIGSAIIEGLFNLKGDAKHSNKRILIIGSIAAVSIYILALVFVHDVWHNKIIMTVIFVCFAFNGLILMIHELNSLQKVISWVQEGLLFLGGTLIVALWDKQFHEWGYGLIIVLALVLYEADCITLWVSDITNAGWFTRLIPYMFGSVVLVPATVYAGSSNNTDPMLTTLYGLLTSFILVAHFKQVWDEKWCPKEE